ncbi:F0F1 ATP synthase subunit gamma [Dellaglioa sp. L3N]
MGASLMEVKRRIASTKKTGQITGAMQVVSTAKLSQIQRHTQSYQIYASKIRSVITHLAQSHLLDAKAGKAKQSAEDDDSVFSGFDMLQKRPVKKSGYLIITSDRGLVGSYNSNVIKQTLDLMKKNGHTVDNAVVIAVGGTGADFFKNRGYDVAYEYRGVSDIPTFVEVREIVKSMVTMYSSEVYDELFVCYNHFVNSLQSDFHSEQMLPISEVNMDSEDVEASNVMGNEDYDMEPSGDAILEVVLPQFAESLVYGAILDAKTAEHASSSTAMKSATDNAKDIISSLELTYNRARQSAITTEITEITGATAALE